MCGFQGRGVVHAIARHGHHLALGLQRLHDAQLLVRRDAGADRDLSQPLAQGPIIQGLHGLTRQGLPIRQSSLSGDLLGGGWKVARDHDDLNACRLTVGHSLGDFGAQGVGQSNQAQPHKVKIVGGVGVALAIVSAVCHRQHAQTLCGHVRHTSQPVLPSVWIQVTQVHDGFGCSFG